MSSPNPQDETSATVPIAALARRRRIRKRVTESAPTCVVGEQQRTRHSRTESRSRSRISGRPLSKQHRKRQFYAVVIVFSLGFFFTLAGTISIGYHNSRGFRGNLLADLERGSGATVEVSQLRVSPTLATARKLEYRWEDSDSALSALVLENVSSRYFVGGLLGGAWNGTDLSAQSAKIYLRRDIFSGVDDAEDFDFKSKYGLDRIRCDALNLYSADGELLIKESVAHFNWSLNPMQLQLSAGELGFAEFGDFIVEHGYVQIQSDSSALFLKLSEKNGSGKLEIKGDSVGSSSVPLVLKIEGIPSSSVIGDPLAQFILADWSGDNGRFSFKQFAQRGVEYAIQLKAPEVSIGRLDCFAVLAEVLNKNTYRRPQFRNGGVLHVAKDASGVSLSDISFSQSRGLALRGSLHASENNIGGELIIGIPLFEKVNLDKHFKEGSFSTTRDGYLWEAVSVSGKSGELKDDLRAKLRSEDDVWTVPQGSPLEIKLNNAPISQQEIEAAFEKLISK